MKFVFGVSSTILLSLLFYSISQAIYFIFVYPEILNFGIFMTLTICLFTWLFLAIDRDQKKYNIDKKYWISKIIVTPLRKWLSIAALLIISVLSFSQLGITAYKECDNNYFCVKTYSFRNVPKMYLSESLKLISFPSAFISMLLWKYKVQGR